MLKKSQHFLRRISADVIETFPYWRGAGWGEGTSSGPDALATAITTWDSFLIKK